MSIFFFLHKKTNIITNKSLNIELSVLTGTFLNNDDVIKKKATSVLT